MRGLVRLGRALLMTAAVIGVFVWTAAAQTKGTFTDSRDGQKYKTVKIGNQTWMAENLRFNVADSWCYDGEESNCQKYGKLYNWNMAKIACPKGWHLPSRNEWTKLVTVVGYETCGRKLKSTTGWEKNGNGTDEFGFSALPGGSLSTDGSGFLNVGYVGLWWTATAATGYVSDGAYYRNIYYYNDNVGETPTVNSGGFSVRCVAD